MNKILAYKVLIALIGVFAISTFVYAHVVVQGDYIEAQPEEESLGAVVYSGEAFDVVGTRSGTTVTPVFWYEKATTTYPVLIDPLAEGGVFTIIPTAASSTGAFVHYNILSSNDTGCDTATTTTSFDNTIVTSDITWTDASPFILNSTDNDTFTSVGTTTISYAYSAPGLNRQLVLDRLNSRCLALRINASSTALWVQYKSNSK